MKLKKCSRCGDKLPITSFGVNNQAPDGLHYYCKECAAEKQRVWVSNNPVKAKQVRQSYLQRVIQANLQRNPYDDNDGSSAIPA